MSKAANLSDYRTIADVQLHLEYPALNSYDYGQQVIQQLDQRISADQPFSFRYQFADAWYDLHHSEFSAHPLTVSFETTRESFPPNIESIKVRHVALYFSRAGGALT
ncbi:MAG: hypothetical protein H0X47_04550 [Nitrospirales bacterium]|nr:hypothetical protein [Nitrospirales bacterium]